MTRLRTGGNFSNHASVCVWWQPVLTTRSPRHVTFLSSNQWRVRLRETPSSSGSVLAVGFYDLLWDYCDEAGTCVSWRYQTGWRDVRSESVTVLHVMRGTEHSRPEQNKLRALCRPEPTVSTLWLLDIRDSWALDCVLLLRISTEIPGPCRYQCY